MFFYKDHAALALHNIEYDTAMLLQHSGNCSNKELPVQGEYDPGADGAQQLSMPMNRCQ
jgi:hypothetical protein